MLLALLNSGYFFLAIVKLSLVEWLAFNACSLAIIIYLICFAAYRLTKKDFLPVIPLLPLYYYGTMGLFLMPFTATNLFAHATHIIITITFGWTLFGMLKNRQFEALGIGLLIGLLAFVPVFAAIQWFTQLHMEEFLKALSKQ